MQRVETLLRDKGRASRDDTSPAGSVLSVRASLHGARLQGLSAFFSTFIIALQRSYGKVMFSVLSVCLSTGGSHVTVTHPTGMLSCSSVFEDFYHLQKLWKSKVFTPVCHSVLRRGEVYTP